MTVKELLVVSDLQLGLTRLCNRFSNLKIDYITLKRFPTSKTEKKKSKIQKISDIGIRKRVSKFLSEKVGCELDILFYCCCVDKIDNVVLKKTQNKFRSKSFFTNNEVLICSFK